MILAILIALATAAFLFIFIQQKDNSGLKNSLKTASFFKSSARRPSPKSAPPSSRPASTLGTNTGRSKTSKKSKLGRSKTQIPTGFSKITVKPDKPLGGIEHNANSCYMASFLYAYLCQNNPKINKLFQYFNKSLSPIELAVGKDIVNEINNIREIIFANDIATLDTLRGLIQKFYKESGIGSINWINAAEDTGAVVSFLSNLFEIPNDAVIEEKKIFTKDSLRKEVVRKINIPYDNVFNIHAYEVRGPIDFNKYIPVYETKEQKLDNAWINTNTKIEYLNYDESYRIIEANMMMIQIDRVQQTTRVESGKTGHIRTKYHYEPLENLPEVCKIGKNTLTLNTIVLHEANHYTTVFVFNAAWYHMNDIKTKPYKIADNFTALCDWNKNYVLTHCVFLLFL